jgi:hypothetical protein
LLESALDIADPVEVCNRVSIQDQEAGFVTIPQYSDLSCREYRARRCVAPHPQQLALAEDIETIEGDRLRDSSLRVTIAADGDRNTRVFQNSEVPDPKGAA